MDVQKPILAHERLKSATQALHTRLDSQPQMRQLIHPGLSVQGYAETLSQLYSWMHEVSLHLVALELPEYARSEHKLAALRADLAALGHSTSTSPRAVGSAEHPFALGVHYVVEGSSMGARILAPRIEASLQRTDLTHFYRLYGDETLNYWQATLARLETELADEEALELACIGASWAFNQLIERFEKTKVVVPDSKQEVGL